MMTISRRFPGKSNLVTAQAAALESGVDRHRDQRRREGRHTDGMERIGVCDARAEVGNALSERTLQRSQRAVRQ